MAWEKRGGRQRYFYLSERRADGRVRKRYFGKGLLAEVESIRWEAKEILRQRQLRERKTILELESMTKDGAASVRTVVEAHLYAAGFHNPKGRGWRRRREMIRPAQTEKREAPQTRVLEIDAEIDRLTLGELVSRCRRGDRAAAKTLRQVLHEYPDLFQGLGQAALKVQTKWIRAITGSDLFEREMALRATRELREALLAEGSGTQLEKLVVEQVISSQLQQAYHESSEAETASRGAEVSKYRQDAIERASRRHMKALGTMATLRTVMPEVKASSIPLVDLREPQACETLERHGRNRMLGEISQSQLQSPASIHIG